ncbi:RNA export mediator Gle1 [Fonsecaea pedrosoi]|nr:RNA export mediator Gle1 [Fonsecaea pedrosoi]
MGQARLHSSSPLVRDSPRGRRTDDSPSRQLQWELERALSQIHLHEIERSKLHAYQKRQEQEELDARESAQAEAHRIELNAAKAQHEIVRKQAEAVLQAYIKQEEEDRQRREEEERRRVEEEERQRRAEAEARAQAQEKERQRQRAELERRAREEKERLEHEERVRLEAERQAKQKAEEAENERREKEAAEQRQREKQAKAEQEAALRRQEAEKAAAVKAAPPQPAARTQDRGINPASEVEVQHANYLVLHKKLKKFRADFWVAAKKDPALKPHVGDMRRAIRTSVGQLTDDKVGNKKAAFRDRPSPPVSVSEYLPAHLNLGDNGTTTIPSLALYLLSIFSKAVISGFVGECAVNPKAAEPIGTLVAQIFSMPELQFPRNVPSTADPSQPSKPTSVSLISILMSKFHATAPILFGISGRESTAAGKHRLGWRLDRITDDPDSKKAFVNENKHYDRLTGLGVGYASIALRNFSKAKVSNPWPPVHYWASLAHIANTPPQEVQTSHLVLLKSMLENNAIERFVLFFGAAGIAALRQAAVDFPRTLPREMQEKPATKTLVLMVEGWKKEKNFSLA